MLLLFIPSLGSVHSYGCQPNDFEGFIHGLLGQVLRLRCESSSLAFWNQKKHRPCVPEMQIRTGRKKISGCASSFPSSVHHSSVTLYMFL